MRQPYISFLVYVLYTGFDEPEHARFLGHNEAYEYAHQATHRAVEWVELLGLHRTDGAVRLMFYRSADC